MDEFDPRFTIIIADDNPSNRLTLKALLSRLPGCDIIEAASGEATLMATMEHECNLILLDIHMPGMNGFETADHLQMTARTRNIPIIFITAVYRADEFISRGYAVGAIDYLVKPIDDNLLLNRVRQYQHLHSRELALEWRTQDLQQTNQRLQKALDHLQHTQDKLVQSEKLAALGSIVAAVAHELNTPIGNCLTVASTLEHKLHEFESALTNQQGIKRSQLEDYLTTSRMATQLMLHGLERTADLVSNFKQVAIDQTNTQRRHFDLKETIVGVVSLMSVSLRKTAYQIRTDLTEGIQMDSYPGPIDQILSNLINNSVIHGFHGRPSGDISIRTIPEGDSVTLLYSDNGCGMSKEVREHVFDPFFTTRLGEGGSGLGMNICYNLITGLLGGSIEILPLEPERGSTFVVNLPLVAPTTLQHG
ncbi:signal transduction histidine kinase [Chitinivorax tropicus]|uniref:histidine kinase n=1 Tax=Chitinivorax tropicus TaxID=714531 RepID=A0A840MNY6_9PROT|nr:response regulator [Chitinivorax tropicus]MBB5018216.1 signal transduction histidine kinase [Chitinivorax tropicus]